MLGKLFKYEFKNTAKVMLTIYGVLITVTLLGMLVLSFEPIRNGKGTAASIILVSYIVLYILSIFALYIVTYVYLTIHFHKTMYSAQGYLTHTLPVKPLTTFHVKLITSLVWMITSTLLMILSILGFVSAVQGPGFGQELLNLDIAEINRELSFELGISLPEFVFILIISLIVTSLASLLMVYASSSIGQLFNQHKIVAAVIAGIVFYFVQQIVAMIVSIIGMFDMIKEIETTTNSVTIFAPMMWNNIIMTLFLSAVYYVTCNIIVRKKINLE